MVNRIRNCYTLIGIMFLALSILTFAIPKQVVRTTHRIGVSGIVEGSPVHGVCSATAIGRHSLLTASHCDLGMSELLVDELSVKIVSRISDGRDHTIFVVDEKFSQYAHLEDSSIKVGDEVWICGNPLGLDQVVRYGHFAGAEIDPDTKLTDDMYDINGWFGDSGAAIFDKHGRIVDVVSFGVSFSMVGTYKLNFTSAQLSSLR